jgi:agmatine/peptidylarginine deiminase
LCILDSIYRPIRQEQRLQEQAGSPFTAPGGSASKRTQDDQVPTLLATALGHRFLGEPIAVARVPLQLAGGDFFTDGAGTGFSSANTLMENGGDVAWVNRLFREYYGLARVVYLEVLPGTIPHIDMFFRPVDGNTFLLAKYPPDVPASSTYYDLIHQEAHQILERNAEILRATFPGAKLIRVTMPPLHFPTDRREMVRSSERVLRSADLDPEDYPDDDDLIAKALQLGAPADRPTDRPLAARMKRQVAEWKKTTALSPDDEFDLMPKARETKRRRDELERRLLSGKDTPEDRAEFKQVDARWKELLNKLDQLLTQNGPTLFHTYLNALHLKGEGREKVLVPVYKLHKKLENDVRKSFELAYPKAEVVFIPADLMVRQFGAIHCMTCVVPDLRPAGSAQKSAATAGRAR